MTFAMKKPTGSAITRHSTVTAPAMSRLRNTTCTKSHSVNAVSRFSRVSSLVAFWVAPSSWNSDETTSSSSEAM